MFFHGFLTRKAVEPSSTAIGSPSPGKPGECFRRSGEVPRMGYCGARPICEAMGFNPTARVLTGWGPSRTSKLPEAQRGGKNAFLLTRTVLFS